MPELSECAGGCAGCKVVVAQSYARIFFRNCVSTCVLCLGQGLHPPLLAANDSACRGEIYPCETDERLCDALQTGVC